uniref:Uncharacterized protein n=1 Tax=Stomoxys calcitrans TaxID=35570 RepID=A0A1I8QAR1_STOCA
MDPLPEAYDIEKPRRNLGIVDMFAGIEDEEYLYSKEDSIVNDAEKAQNHSSRASTPSDDCLDDIHIKSEFLPESNSADQEVLKFYNSNMDCWMILGNTWTLTSTQQAQLRDKLPLGFFWLLEICADTLGVEWPIVYEQLLVIEVMFCMGIENLDEVKNYVHLKYKHPIKEFDSLIISHRKIC